ncbi:MAG: hypothetical protein ACI8RD_003554 [Bacillariaceae sp.]|jgi:hypothetical protein
MYVYTIAYSFLYRSLCLTCACASANEPCGSMDRSGPITIDGKGSRTDWSYVAFGVVALMDDDDNDSSCSIATASELFVRLCAAAAPGATCRIN